MAAGLSIRRTRVRIPPRVHGRVAEWQTPQAQNLVSNNGRAGSSPASATDRFQGSSTGRTTGSDPVGCWFKSSPWNLFILGVWRMAHDRAKIGDQVRLLTRILTPAKLKLAEQRSRKATGVGSTPTAGSRKTRCLGWTARRPPAKRVQPGSTPGGISGWCVHDVMWQRAISPGQHPIAKPADF